VILTALGSIDGFTGTAGAIVGSFTNMNTVLGSGFANDTLTGLNAPGTWNLDATKQYISGNVLTFSDFERLQGGSGVDTFNINGSQTFTLQGGDGADLFYFSNGAVLDGRVNGQTGSDMLDYSAYTSARRIVLTSLGSQDGFAGGDYSTFTSITGDFDNINQILGSSDTHDYDTLVGLNQDSSWTIDTSSSYNCGPKLGFSSFESLVGGDAKDTFSVTGTQDVTLIGGAGDDTFLLESTGEVLGTINGQGGMDTLQYDLPVLPAYDLDAGTATGVWGGISSIEMVALKTPVEILLPGIKNEQEAPVFLGPPWVVLVSGGEFVNLQEGAFNLLILDAPLDETEIRRTGGNYIRIFGDYAEIARLTAPLEAELPQPLPIDGSFVSAMRIELFKDNQPIETLLPWQTMVLSFAIPDELLDRQFAILYWDETLNTWVEIQIMLVDLTSEEVIWRPIWTFVRVWDPTLNEGEGDWVEIPLRMLAMDWQLLGAFQAWEDVPENWEALLPEIAEVSMRAMASVNRTGIFVLVVRE
jgi:hypothetical protein